MYQQVNNQDFQRAVEHRIMPAMAGIGFQFEELKTDHLWDGYFFRRGRDRICVYYLEKDLEFNILISRKDGHTFGHPAKASDDWIYGTLALEHVRSRSLSEAELAEMTSYLDRPSDDIAGLFADQLVEIFSSV